LSSLLRQNGIFRPEDEIFLSGEDPLHRVGVTLIVSARCGWLRVLSRRLGMTSA